MSTNLAHERFKDAPWYGKQHISILGAGGIGSWVALLLAKAGHTLYIYDDDLVELSNIGGQLYGDPSKGIGKVGALINILNSTTTHPEVFNMGRWESDSDLNTITILCFDNMKYRKLAIEKWLKTIKTSNIRNQPKILIDGRMEAETAIIYAIDSPKDYTRYMEEWFDDSVVPDAPCSFRATSHNGAMIASYIVSILNNKITNDIDKQAEKMPIREVPYKIEYELPTLTHKVIL
tara:strand:+ start:311 stop:1012 length:702 start_codon:yes stop_codon:yes gene_type:complete